MFHHSAEDLKVEQSHISITIIITTIRAQREKDKRSKSCLLCSQAHNSTKL